MRTTFRSADLELNFSPISLSSERFEAYTSQFIDKESFHRLRNEYSDCVFHRDGEVIYCVPLNANSAVHGNRQIIDAQKNLRLVSRLVREALISHFGGVGARFSKLNPIRIVDVPNNIADTLNVAHIGIYPEYRFDTRVLFNRESTPILGLLMDVSTLTEITTNMKDLVEKINLNGLYVVTRNSEPKGKGTVCWNTLQGRIERVDDNYIILADYRDEERLHSSECFLEASKRNRNKLIEQLYGSEANKIIYRIEEKSFKLIGGNGKHSAIKDKLDYLNDIGPISCAKGLAFTLSTDLLSIGKDILEQRQVRSPTFIFDPSKNKSSTWHDKGLIEYGPFDAEAFIKKQPKIVVVVPDKYKGEVEQFINSFRNGIPSKYFEKGFIRKYHLTNFGKLDFVAFNVNQLNPAESYRAACLSALEKNSYDLAVVIIEERFHRLFGDENPYLVAKSVFMSQGIAVQEIEIETVRGPGKQYTLNNMGLACYAKLGGIPWTISSLHPVAHELVIGMGSATIRAGRLTPMKRYIGITTVFNSDGNYLFSNLSREVEYENYQEELKRSLNQIIEEVSRRHAWIKGDTIRLIFHQTFKPFRNIEVQAVEDFVSQISDYETEFAFVNVGKDHPYVIFDLNQEGIKDYNPRYRGMVKGERVPERGTLIQLSMNSSLLTVTGPRQLLTPYQACPKPLQVSIHRDSTFKDISYITRQVYEFTFLSWRGFNPTRVPVTILYSDLIASLLGQLRNVKNWNPDILRTKLRHSRWFL